MKNKINLYKYRIFNLFDSMNFLKISDHFLHSTNCIGGRLVEIVRTLISRLIFSEIILYVEDISISRKK